LPGSAFEDYEISEDDATIVTDVQVLNETVQFYWADVGDGREVSVNFTLNGTPCTASATLNVKDPVVTFPPGFGIPPVGSVQLLPPAAPAEVMLTSDIGAGLEIHPWHATDLPNREEEPIILKCGHPKNGGCVARKTPANSHVTRDSPENRPTNSAEEPSISGLPTVRIGLSERSLAEPAETELRSATRRA
jgi:hypothetical protein